MTAHLLDVNMLVALMWPAHTGHARAQQWFGEKSREGWATCPFTESAFVRIVSNPAFSADAVSPQEAVRTLGTTVKHGSHQFWADEITFAEAAQSFGKHFSGHQQTTDAYLLALTIHKKGRFATMDRSVVELLPKVDRHRELIELI